MKSLFLAACLLVAGVASAQTPVSLQTPSGAQLLPYIGANCGGIKLTPTLLGFDTKGYVQVSLALTTTCSTGGRGSTPHTYTGTAPVTYDFTGAVWMGYLNATDPLHSSADGVTAVDAGGDVVTVSAAQTYVVSGTLTINEAPPYPANLYVPMVSVIGDTQAVALAALKAAGYTNVSVNITSTTVYPAGKVFNQSPAAGVSVPAGAGATTPVSIYVARKSGD